MTSPPKPSGDYLTGSLLEYARDPLGFLTRCAREYGDVVRLRFLNLPLYLLADPHDIEQVSVKDNRNFVKEKGERVSLAFLGNGLLTREGDFWRRQRRLHAIGAPTLIVIGERDLRISTPGRLAGRRTHVQYGGHAKFNGIVLNFLADV
jgi:pimeloyl-ACP methyl ester carboxylesterase